MGYNFKDTARKNSSKVTVETQQWSWIQLHSKITNDDTDVLTAAIQDWGNRDFGVDAVHVPYGMNGIEVTFFGIATNQTLPFKWKLYGYRLNGPAQLIAYGTGTLGDTAVVTHPQTGVSVTAYYADFLAITASEGIWKKKVALYDNASRSGGIATIVFDGMGISHLRLELTDCNASTTNETDQLEAVFSGG